MIGARRRNRSETAGTADDSTDAKADVLIVSRDYDTRTIFATALRTAGFAVRELADPDHVVAAVRGCAIVITDFPTETGSGRTVTSLLRSDPTTRGVRILNATTHVWGDELTEASAAGVDATLVLPVFPQRLVDCVRRLLENEGRSPSPPCEG
jgi:CheY-like chemotaxis protein